MKVNKSDENDNTDFLGNYPEIPGYPHFFVLDQDGSYAEFTAEVNSDANGQLKLKREVAGVDLLLHTTGDVHFAGNIADMPGEKTLRYSGRIVMKPRGLDFFGDMTLTLRGHEDRPALSINW